MSRHTTRGAKDLAKQTVRETSGHPVHETPAEGPPVDRRRRIPPLLLWYGVVAGPIAWALHLGTAWSVSELACLAPSSGGVLTHGGSLGGGAWWAVWGGTVIPWLIAVSAVAACLLVTLRRRRLRAGADGPNRTDRPDRTDALAAERVSLLLVLGWFLALMSLAAITGGGIALAVLEPCA